MNNCITPYQFYSEYHQNPINKFIHFITIPLIVISTLSLVSTFQFKLSSVLCNFKQIEFKGDILLTIFYIFYYFTWHAPVNIIMFVYCLSMLYISRRNKQLNDYRISTDFIIFIIAWILQFAGHFFFEGNRPALFDSLSQAFLTAPVFSLDYILPKMFT
jgi:2-hydroxy fatty acid dioxygenase